MKKRAIALMLALSLSCACLQGCFYLVVGAVGAAGGYAISSDTVEGTLERDYEEAWDAAFEVAKVMGVIVKQNDKDGKVEAIINNSRVTITVSQFTKTLIRLRVKARKSFFPNINTAQDVYMKIISQLNQ